jgi:hypothetical protein
MFAQDEHFDLDMDINMGKISAPYLANIKHTSCVQPERIHVTEMFAWVCTWIKKICFTM